MLDDQGVYENGHIGGMNEWSLRIADADLTSPNSRVIPCHSSGVVLPAISYADLRMVTVDSQPVLPNTTNLQEVVAALAWVMFRTPSHKLGTFPPLDFQGAVTQITDVTGTSGGTVDVELVNALFGEAALIRLFGSIDGNSKTLLATSPLLSSQLGLRAVLSWTGIWKWVSMELTYLSAANQFGIAVNGTYCAV